MGEEYKKQHYVPQSYLKRFAERNSNNKGYHIGVRRKDKKGFIKLFEPAVDDIAYQNNIYDIEELDDPKFYEHYFSSEIEPLYGNELSNIITKITLGGATARLEQKDRLALSKMMYFQFVRVPQFLDKHLAKGPQICDKVKQDFLKENGKYLTAEQRKKVKSVKASDSFIKQITLNMISSKESMQRFGRIINQGIFIVTYNNTDIPYITSDNPVILYNFVKNTMDYADNGIANQETVIMFPLSPKIMIEVVPPHYKVAGAGVVDGMVVSLNNDKVEDIRFVIRVNTFQMEHASAEVYMPPAFLAIVKDKEE